MNLALVRYLKVVECNRLSVYQIDFGDGIDLYQDDLVSK